MERDVIRLHPDQDDQDGGDGPDGTEDCWSTIDTEQLSPRIGDSDEYRQAPSSE